MSALRIITIALTISLLQSFAEGGPLHVEVKRSASSYPGSEAVVALETPVEEEALVESPSEYAPESGEQVVEGEAAAEEQQGDEELIVQEDPVEEQGGEEEQESEEGKGGEEEQGAEEEEEPSESEVPEEIVPPVYP